MRCRMLVVAAVLAAAALATSVRGDIVIFKDGFYIHGKVSQDGETITDGGQSFTVPAGPFFIIDFPRRISFSRLQVVEANAKELNREPIVLRRPSGRLPQPKPIYPLTSLLGATPFDDKGERIFKMNMPNGKSIEVEERWTVLTPEYVRVEAKRYIWNSYYRTSELGPEAVRAMIVAHPTIKQQPEKDQLFEIARFFGQAGWYDDSAKVIKEFASKFPDEKDRVDLATGQLNKLKLAARVLDLENARKAGRHKWTQEAIEQFPRTDVDIDLLTKVRVLQSQYERESEQADKARRHLNELAPKLSEPEHRFLNEAAGAILQEITLENAGRLSAFVDLSEQAARDLKNGRKPLNGPPQLLALAVNAWLLNNADSNIDSAFKTWSGRRFLLEYLNNPDKAGKLMEDVSKLKNGLPAVDELAQMVRVLPPPAPEPLKDNIFSLEAPSSRTKGTEYLLQTPPEYTHHRAYPVVIVLHHSNEGPKEMLARCKDEAARHGYLLAAVNWGSAINKRNAEEEQDMIASVVRNVRQRFRVDSDRIFLLGYGEGASMALEVGLAQPSLFAGVLSMNGIYNQSMRYTHNHQLLPCYLVNGTHVQVGKAAEAMAEIYKKWSDWGYPAIQIDYLGRGLEWFSGEVPSMFDWMDRQRRDTGFPKLGAQGREFLAPRTGENRFYWVTTDRGLQNVKQTIYASIGAGNQVNFYPSGLRAVTLWFGRDAEGRTMLSHKDQAKFFRVDGSGTTLMGNAVINPSLKVMMEDLSTRGDREMIFWAKAPFSW